tara:strand:+ start:912 stop:1541 length:630 start_codon:yes stop_codon:yes gene_type:complete
MYTLISSYFSKFAPLAVIFLFFSSNQVLGNSNSKENISAKINLLHDSLKKISESETNNKKDLQDILQVIKQTYDTKKMIRMIVGRQWKNLGKEEKSDLVNIFQEYISHNYLKRFKKINEFNFENIGIDQFGENYKIFKTLMVIPDEDQIKINYLLHKKNGDWRIFDILLSGSISEIATKKSEFKKIIKKGGIKLLIQEIKKKNNSNYGH